MVKSKGAKCLAEALKANKSLSVLDLSIFQLHVGNANIKTDGGEALLEALKENRSLGVLNLWNNPIDEEVLSQIGERVEVSLNN